MKVCFFGIYDPSYARNRILMKGFEQNGYDVVECNANPSIYRGVHKFYTLIREYRKIRHLNFEHVVVLFPGHSIVWLARILFGKNIIFDVFISLYNSEIEERKRFGMYSIPALYYSLVDMLSCWLAGTLLLDTEAHIDYFVERYGMSRDTFFKIYVGSDNTVFFPSQNQKSNTSDFTVHFHGNFIPMHGIEHILYAAKKLETYKDIQFRVVGGGTKVEYKKIRALAKKLNLDTVEFISHVSLMALAELVRDSDVVLGIFGNTRKAHLVIPNKVFEGVACRIPVITADTRAVRELFSDREDILLCTIADGKDIADSILLLKNDQELRMKIAENGFQTFKKHMQPMHMISDLLQGVHKRSRNHTK